MGIVDRVKAVPLRWVVPAAAVVLVVLVFAAVDVHPSLGHVQATILTGSERGNYHAMGTKLAERAAKQSGVLTLVPSHGTVDNLERLAVAQQSGACDLHFAFVQDGVAPPPDRGLELIARLPRGEALFLVGKDAGRLRTVKDLAGLRIGIGPDKSGTHRLAEQVLGAKALASLELRLEARAIDAQLDDVARGDLDLAAFVMHEDSELIRHAIVDLDLQIVNIANIASMAHGHRYLKVGEVVAGQFDPVGERPPVDTPVLEVETLLVGNDCASHAETVGLLVLLNEELPGFVNHNRLRGGSELMPTSKTAQTFFDNLGPELVEVHVPWLVDLLPPANWVYIAMVLSVLFNVMGVGHRFRLWRIDANRVRVDQDIRDALGSTLTPEELHDLEPKEHHVSPKTLTAVEQFISELVTLRDRCRKQSLSMLVPMGQEMAYRYQEDQIEEQLTALRLFRERLHAVLES